MMESRDAVKWLVEQEEAMRKDYVATRLRKLGYNDEFQQSHRNDFVTVHVGDGVFGVVYAPEKRVLFWFHESVDGSRTPDDLDEMTLYVANAKYEVLLGSKYFFRIGEEEVMQERAVNAVLRTRGQQWTAREKD